MVLQWQDNFTFLITLEFNRLDQNLSDFDFNFEARPGQAKPTGPDQVLEYAVRKRVL